GAWGQGWRGRRGRRPWVDSAWRWWVARSRRLLWSTGTQCLSGGEPLQRTIMSGPGPTADARRVVRRRGPSQAMRSVVVHYKELALKGKNRPWFIQLLVRNLKVALTGLHVASVRSIMGRIELELGDEPSWDELRARLSRVFGIANF